MNIAFIRPFFALLGLGLCAVTMTTTAFAQPAPDETIPMGQLQPRTAPPEALIKADMNAVINELKTGQGYMWLKLPGYVAGARLGYFGAQEWFKEWMKIRDSRQMVEPQIVIDKLQRAAATVTVSYGLNSPWRAKYDADGKPINTPQRFSETLTLKFGFSVPHADKVWQIVPPETKPRDWDFPNILGIAAYEVAQRDWKYTPQYRADQSISHLKHVSLGIRQYLQDYNDRYAFAPEYMQETLYPYVKSDKLFNVPNTKEPYSFNGYLSDQSERDVAHAAITTIMLYEGQDEKLTYRYDGKAAVAFADGTARLVTPEEAETLIWKPVPPVD